MRLLTTLLPLLAALSLCSAAALDDSREQVDVASLIANSDEPNLQDDNNDSDEREEEFIALMHGNVRRGTLESSSCYSQTDCNSCSETSGCHWCEHDDRCHVIGSWSGCVEGMTCKKDDDDDDKKKDDSCAQYSTCSECGATHTCHWCAHDDSCHSIGSIYGCVRGVDCFSNDRCRRKEPERLPDEKQTFTNMGLLPLAIVATLAISLLGCASACLCCCAARRRAHEHHNYELVTSGESSLGDALLAVPDESTSSNPEDEVPKQQASDQQQDSWAEETGSTATVETLEDGKGFQAMEDSEQQPQHGCHHHHQQQQQEETPLLMTTNGPQDPVVDQSAPTADHRPKCAKRLLHVCTGFYLLAVVLISTLSFGAIRLYPKIPTYSVCNDAVGWTKLFEKMATGNLMVDFEILISIENPNHLTVVLDEGHGVFKHGGNVIGTYKVPPVKAAAMAISDIMVMATLHPPSWEAVVLAKEYYEDELVLEVDADVVVRTPFFLNFTQAISVRDQPVAITRESDRHLCACKTWDSNTTLFVQLKRLFDGL